MRKPGPSRCSGSRIRALAAAAAGYKVIVEVQNPRGKPFADPVQKLCEEWYPKFNEALFGPDYKLPFKEVKVIFEGEIVFQKAKTASSSPPTPTATPST